VGIHHLCLSSLRYNGPHKTEHHCHFSWCCKANFKLILCIWKPNRMNYALIHSNVWTAKEITRLTQTYALFRDTTLIKSGISKNIRSSKKSGISQFTQLWAVTRHDFKKSTIIFTEYSKEQYSYRHYSQNS